MVSCRVTKSLQGTYKVLCNSQLLFRHRLYADLETILYHVHLFKPLSLLVKQVALYIRNTAPQKAFQALSRCAGQWWWELLACLTVAAGGREWPFLGQRRTPSPCHSCCPTCSPESFTTVL